MEWTNMMEHTNGAFNYVSVDESRPAYYLYKVDPEKVKPLPDKDTVEMPVYDCRAERDRFDLDVEGFAFTDFSPDFDQFYDADAVREHYYPMVEKLVRERTGAQKVKIFDHNVRFDPKAGEGGADRPVRFVHNDYTENSGPQRVKDIMGDAEGADLLQHRYAVINLWRPISGPVQDMPLGVLDAQSMSEDDFVATDLIYKDRVGEVSSVLPNDRHRWYYLSEMRIDEALLLKCFDNDRSGRARYTAHSSFKDPKTPANAPARESIEARALVFF
jgi:hypothetical protein